MKSLTILFSLFIFYSICNSQRTEDVVYIKNSSVIRGKIIDNIKDSIIRIQTYDGSIWAFKYDEVEKMTKEKPFKTKTKIITDKTGYNFTSDFGIFLPLNESSRGYASFGMVHSFNFIPNISTGVGINLDLAEQTYIPVYANLQYYMNKKYIAPFFQISGGYSFPKEKEINIFYRNLNNYGGFYSATSIGIEFPQNENVSLLLSFTWRYQKNHYKSKSGEQFYELFDNNNRYAIKLGLLFH